MGLSLHIALRASLDDVLGACDALRSVDVEPLSFFGTPTAEPSVIGWMPAAAVYFRDPDGHLIEYLAMLPGPARPEFGIGPWSLWHTDCAVRIESHTGPRAELRALFEEAEDSAQQLDAYIGAGDVLVAVAAEQVIGHLQLIDVPGSRVSEIKNMAVAPDQRGRGTGRMLIQAAIDRMRERSRSDLVVATAAADIGNIHFYQRLGFRLRSVERDAFSPEAGYAEAAAIDGIRLRDRVWLDLDIEQEAERAAVL
jgi:ribosomal protein S18 acetylase RimI-like enzyme